MLKVDEKRGGFKHGVSRGCTCGFTKFILFKNFLSNTLP